MSHPCFSWRPLWAPIASLLVLAAAWAVPAAAVVLDDENVVTVSLKDGTKVVLYGEADTSVGAPPKFPPANVQEMARRALGGGDEGVTDGKPSVRIPGHPQSTSNQPKKVAVSAAQSFALAGKITALSRAPVAIHKGTNRYYYLPPGLHLSQRPDGTPEFLFLKFTTEAREDQGGVSGAIMHFLVEWGLTPKQEAEVLTLLRAKVKGAQLMGAVPMEPEGEGATFEVISASLSDKAMATSLVTSGKAPLMPGGKAAVASRLTANGAQLLAATFEQARSITDVSLAVNMGYTTLAPAAKGSITFNWERLEAEKTTLSAEYRKKKDEAESETDCYFFWIICVDDDKYKYSYEEIREQYQFLEEKQIVHLEWLETRNDEKLNKIREAFFDYFLQSMANPVDTNAGDAPAEQAPGGGGPPPIPEDASKYSYDSEAIKAAFQRKIAYFDLNVRLPVKHPLQVVGNLGSWYDAVEDNPKCVASVNLNDPFFQHRDIHFILDLDAKDMFDDAVNYVTVDVRKPRTSGHDFEDHVTIDSKFLKDQGINATVTYARGEDKDPDAYQYRAQWSLRGGLLYPKNPAWVKGRWEGVTLAPPIRPRTIEVEGAIEDMVANDITRITVQIHYPKFGQEVEENISVSPVQGQALVSKKIFLDRGAKGYAYRIIVNLKTKGKLVLPWAARIGDDYIYATIPPELMKEGSPLMAAAQAAAVDLINSGKQKVLERFSELVSGSGGGGQ